MRIVGEDYPGSVRWVASRATSRAGSVADSYINPERLMDDIARLYASRDRVITSLTALDCAAIAAGTPIRSTSARERFMDLGMRLRDIEATARQAWQGEVAAAGGYKPALRPILVKAGECDARGLKNLLAKDGKHIDATEYDELLSILEGAIVKAREAGIEDYAASLFTNLDANTLNRLVRDAANIKYLNADDKLLVQHLGDIVAELRDLFSVVVKAPDLQTRFPQFWSHLETMDPSVVLALLQTGRGWNPEGPLLKGVNPNLLTMIADRVLTPEVRAQNDPNFATANYWRKPMVLQLLREDQLSGGRALSLFLSAPQYDAAGFATVSRHLDALTETSFIDFAGAFRLNTDRENAIRADLLKTYFTNVFDEGSKADVLQAASLLELVIANTSKLPDLSKPMRAALAVGFAGMMTHPETQVDLMDCASDGSGTGRNDIDASKISWLHPRVDIDGDCMGKFIQSIAEEPKAVKTLAAAFGPAIAISARVAQGLPSGAHLPEGLGFIYGSMLRKFDSDAEAKRAFFDGLGLGLTVLFATAGGLAGGPSTSMIAGALGSGILQNITSLVDMEPKNNLDLPMTTDGVRNFFKCAYVLASYKWLKGETKKAIEERLKEEPLKGELPPRLAIVDGMLQIANTKKMSGSNQRRIASLIANGASAEPKGIQGSDQKAIDFFFDRASEATRRARENS
jgi:hypothetical protein